MDASRFIVIPHRVELRNRGGMCKDHIQREGKPKQDLPIDLLLSSEIAQHVTPPT